LGNADHGLLVADPGNLTFLPFDDQFRMENMSAARDADCDRPGRTPQQRFRGGVR